MIEEMRMQNKNSWIKGIMEGREIIGTIRTYSGEIVTNTDIGMKIRD